jgi:hypothetical protein
MLRAAAAGAQGIEYVFSLNTYATERRWRCGKLLSPPQ